jgi:CheY-like chemotaxis protein
MSQQDPGKINILVVEDNPLNQKLVGFMIRGWRMNHEACENGALAVEKIKSGNFDLILMDLEMPVMNGYEATRIIREEMGLTIPIIALTAHESEEEKEKCKKAGINAYITKPINEKALLDVVSGFVLDSDVNK